jgi:YesN/AraC family two-component response regulator
MDYVRTTRKIFRIAGQLACPYTDKESRVARSAERSECCVNRRSGQQASPIRPGDWLKQHAFLIRTLVSTLLAACIPLIIISFMLINREKENIDHSAVNQLTATATSIAIQFDQFVNTALAINTRMQLDSKLFDSTMAKSVQGEIEALEVIEYLKPAVPFVHDFGLFVTGNPDAFYSTTGKYKPDVYTRLIIGIDTAQFSQVLTTSSRAYFVAWEHLQGNMLFLAPMRVGSATAITRTGFYLITPATLKAALNSLLATQYGLAAIYDTGGTLIYREAGSPIDLDRVPLTANVQVPAVTYSETYLVHTAVSAQKYRLVVYMNQTEHQQNVAALTSSVRSLAILNVLICLALLFLAVLLNYQSFRHVFLSIRRQNPTDYHDKSELQYIMTAFTDQIEEKDRLKLQVYEQQAMIVDSLFEKLLKGQPISAEDHKLLHFHAPHYFVANMTLAEAKDVERVISQNTSGGGLHAIEMVADKYLTILCGCADPSIAGRKRMLKAVRTYIGNDQIRLGVSKSCAKLEHLAYAYLEASRALNSEETGFDVFADHLVSSQTSIIDEDDQLSGQLTYALKTGDDAVINYVKEAFATIIGTIHSYSAQRYACFQVIERIRQAAQTVSLDLDLDSLSHILYQGSIQAICNDFCALLSVAGEQQRRQNAQALDLSYASIITYINDNYTDALFGLNNVADHFGMTIYAASRMLKSLIGINFRKYLNSKRVEYAKDLLLTTDLSVNDISDKAGFTSSSYFISIFRQFENKTPNKFRSDRA